MLAFEFLIAVSVFWAVAAGAPTSVIPAGLAITLWCTPDLTLAGVVAGETVGADPACPSAFIRAALFAYALRSASRCVALPLFSVTGEPHGAVSTVSAASVVAAHLPLTAGLAGHLKALSFCAAAEAICAGPAASAALVIPAHPVPADAGLLDTVTLGSTRGARDTATAVSTTPIGAALFVRAAGDTDFWFNDLGIRAVGGSPYSHFGF